MQQTPQIIVQKESYLFEIDGYQIWPFIIVAMIWGSTDVLIARCSKQQNQEFQPVNFSPLLLIKFILQQKIWIWMAINQCGSILYAYLLGIYPEEISLLWANSLTVIVAFLLDKILSIIDRNKLGLSSQKNQDLHTGSNNILRKQLENIFGIIFILIGLYLMLI